jgi:glycosyltransferase involved in cell wall biosynthesis
MAEEVSRQDNQRYDYVPFIVDMPAANGDFRRRLGIPRTDKVIGRYGGYEEFDIPWVMQTIAKVLEYRTDLWFLFLNTRPFIAHPRVIYAKPIFDRQTKANFIATCDAMIHARISGEGFGQSIAEFLSQNKPVIAWSGGYDRYHTVMLENSGLLYSNPNELEVMINGFSYLREQWSDRILPYSPTNVMSQFNKVFL